ncbi:uncharacterized protein LOC116348788 [Contarinia nasturtii]|uniref:uncharacterized protein LOC116348788 n=1 Tax=Contarinia nasturtii TaxID=265458 RepID=UPI0012D39719|nr:uncharacterized protein LOC116348788 [Contarinia nasturtii]
MKLFAVVFCIAIMVNALSAGKLSKEEKAEQKAQKKADAEERKALIASKKVQVEVNLINQRLEMMQETVDNTWTMAPYIPVEDLNELRALSAEEKKHQDGFQTILDEVLSKMEEVVGVQEGFENDLKEAYASHRGERGDEESILTAIQDAVNNADLENKDLKGFASLHKKLIAIHDEFKTYERFVKAAEKKFLDKMFPRMANCYFSIQSGIYNLCGQARKAIYDHKVFKNKEIEKISATAKKSILDKLDKGLEWKNKDIAFSQMKDSNEKQYRKHYDIVKKHLDAIVNYLNPEAESEDKDDEE